MSDEKATIETEAEVFRRLLDGLLAQHDGKFALIHAGELSGVFDSIDAAYANAIEKFGTDAIYIGRISKQQKVEHAPALYHGLIHARL